MTPDAPGLLSTTIGCPSRGPSRCATVRAMMSVPPPAGNGTTSWIGFCGHGACAATVAGTVESAAAHSDAATERKMAFIFVVSSYVADAELPHQLRHLV